jgi:hypothetical protein
MIIYFWVDSFSGKSFPGKIKFLSSTFFQIHQKPENPHFCNYLVFRVSNPKNYPPYAFIGKNNYFFINNRDFSTKFWIYLEITVD